MSAPSHCPTHGFGPDPENGVPLACALCVADRLDELWSFVRLVPVVAKHGPGGSGRDGPCDAWCIKCAAEKLLERAPGVREQIKRERLEYRPGGEMWKALATRFG